MKVLVVFSQDDKKTAPAFYLTCIIVIYNLMHLARIQSQHRVSQSVDWTICTTDRRGAGSEAGLTFVFDPKFNHKINLPWLGLVGYAAS